ncbi:MAG: putative Ig domain-containing protein [Bryobacterales bacterium]|nr:putative Ig domain-containing protein [Bryobacterales bacterium]
MTLRQLCAASALAFLALVSTPSAQAISWVDGPTKTIYYTPGSPSAFFIYTDTAYAAHGTGAITIISGTLPAGLNWNYSGSCGGTLCASMYGTPTATTVSSVTLRANDFGPTADIVITFRPPLSISGTLSSPVIAGTAYNSSLSAVDGTAPFTWSISSGALPAGLSLNSSTGAVTGTPSAAGTSNFTVRLADSASHIVTSTQSIQVLSPLSVTTTSLPATSLGGSYSQLLTSSGGAAPKTWSIAYGGLPAGLSLNASTGVISGVPSFAGVSTFTVEVGCCGGATAQKELTILVNPAPTVSTTSLSQGVVGGSYSSTLAGSNGTTPYTWSLASGALPAGLSLGSSGAITGTPTTAGTASLSVQLTDAAGATATQPLTLQVLEGPTITTSSFNQTTVGQSVSVTLAATNGTTPYTWSISAGVLPAGLSLNPSTGAITGSPATAGTASFTARVSDANSVTDSKALSMTVNAAPSITTSTLPETTVGASYASTMVATGGTGVLTWSISSGALPAGVTLNSTGSLSGTPTTAGTASFTVKVTDTNSVEATKELSIVVNPPPSITTSSLPFGVTSESYSQTAAATGGTAPLTWSVASGSLPSGIALSSTTGEIHGAPSGPGDSTFLLRVTDARGVTDDFSLMLTVHSRPQITTTSPLPALTVSQTVSQTLAATSGTTPYVWSVSTGSLPDGLTLNPSTGVITGVPTAEGAASFSLQVADAHDLTDEDPFEWMVNPAPQITTSELPPTTVSRPFGPVTLAATGGTGALSWSATGLPAGVTVDAGTGVVSGTPSVEGTFTATFTATDTNSVDATAELTLTVNPLPEILTTELPRATVGGAYSFMLSSTGGTAPLTWDLICSTLPAGMTLSPEGLISGTPLTAEILMVDIEVADHAGATDVKTFNFQVVDDIEITTTSLPIVTAEQVLNIGFSLSGGFAPFTWSVIEGALPQGVALDPATGMLSGAAVDGGTYVFTMQATDVDNRVATRTFEWLVNPPLRLLTTALPHSTFQHGYAFQLQATGGTGVRTFSAAALPTGVSLHPTTGWLTGLFPVVGDTVIVISVTEENGVVKTKTFTVTVSPALSILTETLPTLEQGKRFQFRFEAEGGRAGLTWWATPPGGTRVQANGLWMGLPATAGPARLQIGVEDANGARAERVFDLVIEERVGFQAQPGSLSFQAVEGGSPTAPQQVAVTSVPANRSFEVSTEAGWLAISASSSMTPAVLDVVADPAGLEPGDYEAVIVLGGTEREVTVQLTVAPAGDPSLSVFPTQLTIEAEAGGAPAAALALARLMGEAGPVAAEVVPGADWLSVETRLPVPGADYQAVLKAEADPAGLEPGVYEGEILVTAGELSFTLPVHLEVFATSFRLSHSGLTFDAVEGQTNPPTQTLRVLNQGVAPLDWQASADAPWAAATPPAGTANPSSDLVVSVDASGLEAGVHESALVVEPQSGAAGRSALVRFNLDPDFVLPQVGPAGLLFVSQGGAVPEPQQVALSYNGAASLEFVHAVAPSEATWLSVSPSSGAVPAGGETMLTAAVQPAGLAPGAHQAALSVEFADGTVRVVEVTLIVAEEGCVATRLEPVFTKLGDHFQTRMGWPAPIELLVVDDCGQPVSEGAGLVELSSPDEPAIELLPGPGGLWTGTWVPAAEHGSITATATVENADRSLSGEAQSTGAVDPE